MLTISEMNDKETALEADKVNNDKIHVGVVTVCLTPNHSKCTGLYEDHEGKDQLKEEQEEEIGEINKATTNQVF